MKILKIYPAKFPINTKQNSSIYLASKPYVDFSCHDFHIISSYTENPIEDPKIIYLQKKDCLKINLEKDSHYIWNMDNRIDNQKYILAILKEIHSLQPDLIEVELDHELASEISTLINNKIPVALVSHLNLIKSFPTKTIKRFFIYKNIDAFIFVSQYFRKTFIRWFPFFKSKTYVVRNSYKHIDNKENIELVTKKNQIVFIGRAILAKGIKEYCQAVSEFLESNKNWQAIFIGALERQKEIKDFDKIKKIPSVAKAIEKGWLKIYTNIDNKQAFEYLKESRIAVFPTIAKKHQEGIPMVALEAAMAKCLMLTSLSGGYPEINPFKATLMNKINKDIIKQQLNLFINNETELKLLQEQQYEFVKNNFEFTNLMKEFDEVRNTIVKKYKQKT